MLKWCLLSESWSYIMVSFYQNWHTQPIMLKSAIFGCFPYILYRIWLKITFCFLPILFHPSEKAEIFRGTFFYNQDDILKFWRWLHFSKLMWHDSRGCASDRLDKFTDQPSGDISKENGTVVDVEFLAKQSCESGSFEPGSCSLLIRPLWINY